MSKEITATMQQEILFELMQSMDVLNDELPVLAGSGDLGTALTILNEQLTLMALHTQRTYVLLNALLSMIVEEQANNQPEPEFTTTGKDFNGTSSFN